MKLEFSRQIFEKISGIIFDHNPSIGSWVVPSGRTDNTKLIVVFRNFAFAPRNCMYADLRTRLQRTAVLAIILKRRDEGVWIQMRCWLEHVQRTPLPKELRALPSVSPGLLMPAYSTDCLVLTTEVFQRCKSVCPARNLPFSRPRSCVWE
jgi:hypothetical protein